MTFYLDQEVNEKASFYKDNEWIYEKYHIPAGEISAEEMNKFLPYIEATDYAHLEIISIDVEKQIVHIIVDIL